MKSFYSYLKSKSKQQSPVGDFARDTIRASQEHPCIKKYGPIGLWLFIKNKYPVCDEAFFALSEASKEYGYRDFFIKFYDIQSAIDDCNFPVHPQLIEGFLSNAPAYLEGQVALVYDAYWLEKSTVKEFVKSFLKLKTKMIKKGF